MARIVLGVSGGIAAYKSVEVLRLLTESGHHVRVVPTAAALRFVGAPTWSALSGQPVTSEVWTRADTVDHVQIGADADLVVVAPATADLLARAANGLADDLLTNVLLTARCPVLFVPAMHTQMWEHPATVANVAQLRSRGAEVLPPAVGRLTGADSGPGRLPEPAEIARRCEELLEEATPQDLAGMRVVVSAGGTREPLDPVRYLGNRSSGRQGFALAEAARDRGADVTLVVAHAEVPAPDIPHIVTVETAAQLHEAMRKTAVDADVVVMTAAVADYRPESAAPDKIKKSSGHLQMALVPTTDVLADLLAHRVPGQVVVGFAAETGDATADWREHGRAKFARKQPDVLVVNEVGADRGFGTETNAVLIVTGQGREHEVPAAPKREIADAVWDAVVPLLTGRPANPK